MSGDQRCPANTSPARCARSPTIRPARLSSSAIPQLIEPALRGAPPAVRARVESCTRPQVVGMAEHPREAIRRKQGFLHAHRHRPGEGRAGERRASAPAIPAR